MDEDCEISKLEESLEGPYLIRVELPANDAEKTFIAPSKTFSQPLSDDEEEFSLDSLDFNFTNCGESYGRRSIIGQINHNHNLSAIAADYASTSIEEETIEQSEESIKEPSSERVSESFDPYDLMITKKIINVKTLTPKQAGMTMSKLSSRLETSKKMYPTIIKDNMVKNLKKVETNLLNRIQELENERKKPLDEEEDEENNLLMKIVQQLEHKLSSLNEKLNSVSDMINASG